MPEAETALSELLPRIWNLYKVPLILGALSLTFIFFSIVLLVKSVQTTTPITFTTEVATASGKPSESMTVDVEGAVVRPGIYRLPKGARVEEVLVAAGGLSAEADVELVAKTINRAAVLLDGAKLYVPKVGETQTLGVASQNRSLVNINTAGQAELEVLSGVGPVTAGKIIAGRPYQTLSELVTKKIMSQSLFTKLQNLLSL